MQYRLTLLTVAMAAAVALPALAERGHDGPRGAFGPGERPSFAELDTDGNGELTVEEFQARGEARFAAADTNGDGALSAAEVTAAATARSEERVARMAARMMERMDADQDGLITQAEMTAAREGRGGPRVERMIERMDTDGSGTVSADEFAAMVERGAGKGPRQGENR